MTISKRLRLAISLAPLLGAVALATPVAAAPPSGGQRHFDSGHGDFRHDRDRHFDRGGFGFGFGFGDPWWGWGPADYWGAYPYYYPYPYPYPYYYPPYPASYAPPPGYLPPQGSSPAQATGAAPPQYWYYCDNPQGYYPYVQNCSTTWKQVAATAPSGSGNTITPKPKP